MRPLRLDDRDYAQLRESALEIVTRRCPAWTDRSPGDPGIVLLELFAHLTEVLIYRLNRLPEKAFVEFVRLMGTRLHAPEPARVVLRFSRKLEAGRAAPAIAVPAHTVVTIENARTDGARTPTFVTVEPAAMAAGAAEVDVEAFDCELVEREPLQRRGTGLAGQFGRVRRPPIVAAVGRALHVAVEVEAAPEEDVPEPVRSEFDGRVWRRWREVDDFVDVGDDPFVYRVDRATGTISFAPALRAVERERLARDAVRLAAVPDAGREIRVSYWRGGGAGGNVAAGTLKVIRSAAPAGLVVTNPTAAAGGNDVETLANALLRAPQELQALRRAVTARDFERLALQSAAVRRARALARVTVWAHAPRGEVEVLLVPDVPAAERPADRVTAAALAHRSTDQIRQEIVARLGEQAPLGTRCSANWARCKTVTVRAAIVVKGDEDRDRVAAQALQRVNQLVNPLPTDAGSGWEFGRPLRDSQVVGALLSVHGVIDVRPVELVLEEAPDTNVTALAIDHHQPRTFYAASTGALFRSLDDGQGWELCRRFDGAMTDHAVAHPERAGMVAVVTRRPDVADRSTVHVSEDCGETWIAEHDKPIGARVDDLAWSLDKDGNPVVWLATDKGLFKVLIEGRNLTTLQVAVDKGDPDRGFRAVVAFEAYGRRCLAVATDGGKGVYLSFDEQGEQKFSFSGLRDKRVRTLAVQTIGPRVFLWAGIEALNEDDRGAGVMSCEIPDTPKNDLGWHALDRGWDAGTCYAIAFRDSRVLAASFKGGVLWADFTAPDPAWNAAELTCGLPIHGGRKALDRIDCLALRPGMLLAGGPNGIHRAAVFPGTGRQFELSSARVFTREPVTIPSTWLFCSGEHQITVEPRP